jgi:hypothetical protein
MRVYMAGKMKHLIGIIMGLIVLVLDAYWTYLASAGGYSSLPFMLGAVIFIATLIWLWADL